MLSVQGPNRWVCCQHRDQTGGCVVSTGTKQVGVLSVQGPNRWVCCQYRVQTGGCVVSTRSKQVGVLSVQGPNRWVCCQYKVQTGGCVYLQLHNIKKLIEELQSWFHTKSLMINKNRQCQ